MNEDEIKELVLTLDSVKKHVGDVGQIKRIILVPGKIVNIVV
jgi:leucyl-tRNA synthetase